jgi:hypothetical protein
MTDSPLPDHLAFTPVATSSTRCDGWTPERQRQFVALLMEFGSVAVAARAVGMTPQSANRLRKRADAESFARAWDAALQQGRDQNVERAVERGRDGYYVPVTRKGRVVGQRHRFDNRLLYAACYAQPMGRW